MSKNYKYFAHEPAEECVSFLQNKATGWFDTLTEKPFNEFFITTDHKRSAPASAPDLINDII